MFRVCSDSDDVHEGECGTQSRIVSEARNDADKLSNLMNSNAAYDLEKEICVCATLFVCLGFFHLTRGLL